MVELNNICDGFSSLAVCAISLNNLYQLKIIMLSIIAIFSIYFIYQSKTMIVNNTFDFYKRICIRYPSMVFLTFAPFWVLLLRPTISFDLFITLIIGLYMTALALAIGGFILFGVKSGNDLVAGEDTMTVGERFKYRGNRSD